MAVKKKAVEPKKIGRPLKDISEKQVEDLAAIGCTTQEIATIVGCHQDTLYARFSDSMKRGRDEMKRSLRKMQFDTAKGGSATMQIWLGKQYLGQKDKSEVETVPADERARVERAIDAFIRDTGGSRDEAIKYLTPLMPEINSFVN